MLPPVIWLSSDDSFGWMLPLWDVHCIYPEQWTRRDPYESPKEKRWFALVSKGTRRFFIFFEVITFYYILWSFVGRIVQNVDGYCVFSGNLLSS